METNNRNYKNPTVIAWEQLRQLLTQFADRMQNFDAIAQKQGRGIGVDEVFNEIQNIRKQLDEIQKGLNLQNNTINTERVVDKSQPETPFSITNNNRNNESKNMNKKLIRLTESDLHKIVKESVKRILRESINDYDYFFAIPNYDYDPNEPWEDKYGVKETNRGLEIYDAEDNRFVSIIKGRTLSDYKIRPDMARVDLSNVDDERLINDMNHSL